MAREFPTPNQQQSKPSHEEIARRAYEIFIERGQPLGRDLDHWLEAESQLSASMKDQKSRGMSGTKPSRTGTRQNARRT